MSFPVQYIFTVYASSLMLYRNVTPLKMWVHCIITIRVIFISNILMVNPCQLNCFQLEMNGLDSKGRHLYVPRESILKKMNYEMNYCKLNVLQTFNSTVNFSLLKKLLVMYTVCLQRTRRKIINNTREKIINNLIKIKVCQKHHHLKILAQIYKVLIKKHISASKEVPQFIIFINDICL